MVGWGGAAPPGLRGEAAREKAIWPRGLGAPPAFSHLSCLQPCRLGNIREEGRGAWDRGLGQVPG